LPDHGVDLCFTSPPYFSTERYSEEETQSWKKFPDPDSWMNGFIGPTLDNCNYCLKPDGVLAINIADVKEYRKLTRRQLTDDFVALAVSKGWRPIEKLELELSAGPGAKHKHGKHKPEPIFVFKKRS
jgi:DNA modification methylase